MQGSDPGTGRGPGDRQDPAEGLRELSEAEDGESAPVTEGGGGGDGRGEHRPEEDHGQPQEEQ